MSIRVLETWCDYFLVPDRMAEECDCDAWAQQVYDMSRRMNVAFDQNDRMAHPLVDSEAPEYIQSVVSLGRSSPDNARDLKKDYEQRLHTHNAAAVLLTPELRGGELTKRDRKIAQELVRSNMRYDQEVLRSKMGWGQWLGTALSQRPRW